MTRCNISKDEDCFKRNTICEDVKNVKLKKSETCGICGDDTNDEKMARCRKGEDVIHVKIERDGKM